MEETELYLVERRMIMATIVKRRKKYSVVYTYTDGKGKKRQKWETFDSNAEAKKRKLQVEYEQQNGIFVVPNATTVNELLDEYMAVYGVNKWALSTYDAKRGLIKNYISPIIGNMKLEDINTRVIDKYYRSLLKVKSVVVNNRPPKNEYVTASVVREIHKLLRSAFNQAVKWELVNKNPIVGATLPEEELKPRTIWDSDTLFKALELCDDENLALAINLAFSCSLRIGELLGLTWDCIDISPTSIENQRAYIFVNKELQRVNRDSLEKLNEKGVLFKFPPMFTSTHTSLVLKEPKTKSSTRKVFLPSTVAVMLLKRKEEQEEHKELFGNEYCDYNLVFATANGRPIEGQVLNRALKKLIEENGLPKVVFHSFRHSSITYKLKLNGGDIKSVQGDSGHSQVKMVADVYSHIIDEDRCMNAQRFEKEFYNKEETVSKVEEKVDENDEIDTEMLAKLLKNPEMAVLIKTLINNV